MGIYLDTSALAKLYRPEIGTSIVERMINDSSGECFISRLGVLVPFITCFPGKMLSREVSSSENSPQRTPRAARARARPDSALVLKRFRKDIRERRFYVLSLRVRHYETAQELVNAYGPSHGLRTLDSLHLAAAIALKAEGLIDAIVVADKILARVAVLEGLRAIDPEAGSPD